ncbi:hypothetical protein GOODEAATRI_000301 [Goodea atripinnis]|uniref:Uncharacterized protein n=1 Tax=Goodea atripinnis TaxID=208336 RepID=A0ABV0MDT0_9TELE
MSGQTSDPIMAKNNIQNECYSQNVFQKVPNKESPMGQISAPSAAAVRPEVKHIRHPPSRICTVSAVSVVTLLFPSVVMGTQLRIIHFVATHKLRNRRARTGQSLCMWDVKKQFTHTFQAGCAHMHNGQ